jgi:hypothetical protein
MIGVLDAGQRIGLLRLQQGERLRPVDVADRQADVVKRTGLGLLSGPLGRTIEYKGSALSWSSKRRFGCSIERSDLWRHLASARNDRKAVPLCARPGTGPGVLPSSVSNAPSIAAIGDGKLIVVTRVPETGTM